jgi:predicted Rossmann-fold nucleotide-binding protein
VVLFGGAYWDPMLRWIDGTLLAQRLISPEDLRLLTVTDDPAEAVQGVVDRYRRESAHES